RALLRSEPISPGDRAMKRRSFLGLAAAATAACGMRAKAQPPAAAAAARKVRMHVGCQRGPTTPRLLDHFKRHGVEHICGHPPDPGPDGHWSVDDLKRTKDLCQRHGVSLDMVALPFLSSSHIDSEPRGAIMLGEAQRDRDIEHIQKMIVAC